MRIAKNKAVRDAGQAYLEALRRAIEMADGLDVIFDRHMTDRTGKYIVFCASKEHMDEMTRHVPEWFAKVDPAPHVYSIYTEDPTASKSFRDFKQDGDTTHLRLLFAIDVLNEGIHVEDISGVILLRPTISPIVYKQQIGRALSASSAREPVIFDIVNNIENLYSIGAVEEEIRAAVLYYRSHGEGQAIANEGFEIFDEVRDCRELFEKLNDTLSASWDVMYAYGKAYYEEFGNLEVPRRYKTPEGYSLGSWVSTQRKVRAGYQVGKLDGQRIAKLDAIGMRWESVSDLSWERYYEAAKTYFADHGDLNVKVAYITKDGVRLGNWIANLRGYRRSGIKLKYMTPERLKLLDDIGMIWDQPDYLWEQNYAAALAYYRENGHLAVPHGYVTEDGIRLGAWISRLRRQKNTLSKTQIQRLDELQMIWEDRQSKAWEAGYTQAERFYREHGDLNVPASYISPDGYRLGNWIYNQQKNYQLGKLPIARKVRLDSLDMAWKRDDPWEVRYALAKDYFERHGDLEVPADYVTEGVWLHKWLSEQKQIYRGNRKGKALTVEQVRRLESIGMCWTSQSEQAWERRFQEAREYYAVHGSLNPPPKSSFRAWLNRQRENRKKGRLSREQIQRLTDLGMVWECEDAWEIGYAHAEEYIRQGGTLPVPHGYASPDGYRLGAWWERQRAVHNGKTQYGSLSQERAEKLEALGMVWQSHYDTSWMENYRLFKQYMEEHHQEPQGKCQAENGTDLTAWLRTQREKYRQGQLDGERVRLLEELSVDWLFPQERAWENYYTAAQAYVKAHGDLAVPGNYKTPEGLGLGRWVRRMAEHPERLKTTWANGDQAARLRELGMFCEQPRAMPVRVGASEQPVGVSVGA